MKGELHHVEINVSDLKISEAFWGWFLPRLGYNEYQRWGSGVSYRLGETYLVFVETEEKSQGFNRKRIGLNHFAFHAESREEVDVMTQELRSQGRSILYEDKHPYAGGTDHYAVYFEDPDGIKVEFVAPK